MQETEKTREAFRYYCALGWRRSYKKVAEHFGVTLRTVERWGRTLNWVDRTLKLRLEEEENLNLKRMVRDALMTYLEVLRENRIKDQPVCNSIAELEKLIKLDLLLSGDPADSAKAEEIILRFAEGRASDDAPESAEDNA